MARLAWFLHRSVGTDVEKISARARLTPATLRRYMQHEACKIRLGGGPQKLPVVLRILDALEVSPCKVALALHYAQNENAFWRLMSSQVCVEQRVVFEGADTLQAKPRLLRLEVFRELDEETEEPRAHTPVASKMQWRYAWFLGEQLRGRIDEIHARTGIAPKTLRRYSTPDQAHEFITGPQKIRTFGEIVAALNVNVAKLAVASYYASDTASFMQLMNSTLCVEEVTKFRCAGPEGVRIDRKIIRLEDDSAPPQDGELFGRLPSFTP